MATYLLLDKDRRAINVIEWDGASEHAIAGDGVVSFVRFDGAFREGWAFDGAGLVDPSPPPEAPPPPTPTGVEEL